LRNFFVEEIAAIDGSCRITGAEARHISRVLRMRPGDRLILMDKKGSSFQACIESITARQVKVRVERPLEMPRPSTLKITLCQAITKSQSMDYIIQKASELGVDCVVPFFSDRSVVRLDQDRLPKKMAHWKGVAENSAKQCGRAVPIKVESPSDLSGLLERWHEMDALKVILWEKEEAKDLKTVFRSTRPTGDFAGIIGPEGGFTENEVDNFMDAGFIPVSLGARILRAETAAIAIAVIVQYELGDLGLNAEQT
jgi:16S rRNA (uracil1498-N3)-methyltransferase